MNSGYDMCVDYQTLEELRMRLKRIGSELTEATKQMVEALQVSQDFLAGRQFEEARVLTLQTVEVTTVTSNNIENAIRYLDNLMAHVSDYESSKYTGG